MTSAAMCGSTARIGLQMNGKSVSCAAVPGLITSAAICSRPTAVALHPRVGTTASGFVPSSSSFPRRRSDEWRLKDRRGEMGRAVGPFWFGGPFSRGDAPGWNHGGPLALGTMCLLLGSRANGPLHTRPGQGPGDARRLPRKGQRPALLGQTRNPKPKKISGDQRQSAVDHFGFRASDFGFFPRQPFPRLP